MINTRAQESIQITRDLLFVRWFAIGRIRFVAVGAFQGYTCISSRVRLFESSFLGNATGEAPQRVEHSSLWLKRATSLRQEFPYGQGRCHCFGILLEEYLVRGQSL